MNARHLACLTVTVAAIAFAGPAFSQASKPMSPSPMAKDNMAKDAMKKDPMANPSMSAARTVRITIDNLTTGQGFSPSFFATQAAGAAPIFKPGEAASPALTRVAEEGNIGPFSGDAAGMLGKGYGDAVLAIHTPPGGHRTLTIQVDKDHPLLSGVWMLGMTNDGFSGFTGLDVYDLKAAKTVDLMGWDAGTEKNNEKKEFMGALGGNQRDPENGMIAPHAGIRGDADAPATWKFDPAKPVARVTIEPLSMKVGG